MYDAVKHRLILHATMCQFLPTVVSIAVMNGTLYCVTYIHIYIYIIYIYIYILVIKIIARRDNFGLKMTVVVCLP